MTVYAADLDLDLDVMTVQQDGRVLTVRVCDPPYNYVTSRLQLDLDRLTAAVDADDTVGAVMLTGGVPQRYITHFDIDDLLVAAERGGRTTLPHSAILGLLTGVGHLSAVPGAKDVIERSPVAC